MAVDALPRIEITIGDSLHGNPTLGAEILDSGHGITLPETGRQALGGSGRGNRAHYGGLDMAARRSFSSYPKQQTHAIAR